MTPEQEAELKLLEGILKETKTKSATQLWIESEYPNSKPLVSYTYTLIDIRDKSQSISQDRRRDILLLL